MFDWNITCHSCKELSSEVIWIGWMIFYVMPSLIAFFCAFKILIFVHQNKLTSDSSSTTRGYAKISVTLKSRNYVTQLWDRMNIMKMVVIQIIFIVMINEFLIHDLYNHWMCIVYNSLKKRHHSTGDFFLSKVKHSFTYTDNHSCRSVAQ